MHRLVIVADLPRPHLTHICTLQELSKGVYIMGIISLCFTGVSALTALACLIPVLTRRTYGKALFLWAQLLS